MNRKWTVLSAALVSFSLLVAGISVAQDKEDSPIHKLMEKVGAKNNAINKAVRTPVAFKKAGKNVGTDADELIKLMKDAKDMKEPATAQKKKYEDWTKLSDAMTKSLETFKTSIDKGQPEAKKSFEGVKKACADCHKDFRVEEDFK